MALAFTAAIGRHFGRPDNRFWPALHGGGFAPRLFSPYESALLLDLKYGITNIVQRATARADELTDDELRADGKCLQAKVRRLRPTFVAFVGIHPYRVVSGTKNAHVGLQETLFRRQSRVGSPQPQRPQCPLSARCPRATLWRTPRLGHRGAWTTPESKLERLRYLQSPGMACLGWDTRTARRAVFSAPNPRHCCAWALQISEAL